MNNRPLVRQIDEPSDDEIWRRFRLMLHDAGLVATILLALGYVWLHF